MADVVVVGAGLAGARTCTSLRSAGFVGRITLVGAEADPPYDRPPLTKDPSADVDLRTTMELDVWAAADDVRLGTGARGLSVRPGSGGGPARLVVECTDGSQHEAGAVVLASGADPILPDDWSRPGVHLLHTRAQARVVWSRTGPGTRAVIVGGGWIGCEAAATAAARGARVLLREAGSSVLAGRLPGEVAERVSGWLLEAGVSVHVRSRVTSVEVGSPQLSIEGRPADLVVVALGVRPSTGWLSGSGIRRSPRGSVLVDGLGRASIPGVFALGDCAARWSPRRRAHLPGGHWTEALNAPERVAPAVTRWVDGQSDDQAWDAAPPTAPADPIPYVFSEIGGRHLQLLGAPEAGRVVWRSASAPRRTSAGSGSDLPGQSEAWTAFSLDPGDRLVGLCTVGRPRDLVVARRAMLGHASGTPRADPGAMADPDAAASSMFPGEA